MSTYADIPKGLTIQEQMIICVGKLVAEWANCESVFYAVFFCLSGRPNGNADILWYSVQSTRLRMEIIGDLLRYEKGLSSEISEGLVACIKDFKPITQSRNFYCHSVYHCDDTGLLSRVENWHVTDPEIADVVDAKVKPASKATINEICVAIDNCRALNERAIKLVYKLRDALQLQHVKLPPLPHQSQSA